MDNDLKLLTQLDEKEIEQVKLIMGELVDKGKSNQLDDLYYDDYEEIPVDIWTFLSSEQYLGNYTNNGKDIYDTWKEELRYVHNPINFVDQWAITR